MVKEIRQDRIFNIINTFFLLLIGLVVYYPLHFVLIASISDPNAVNSGEVWFLPVKMSLLGYQKIFEDARIWQGYTNTIIYTLGGTLLGLTNTILAAYALSRKDLYGRKIIMLYFMITMYFGGGLIPTYMLINKLGLYNTPLLMILLGSVNVWNLIVAKTFFQTTIPDELLDAARIDGCSNWRFFTSIVLPLSKSILAVIALYYAVAQWNQFFSALIYLSDRKLQPLQIVLRDILINNQLIKDSMMDYEDLAERELIAEYIKYGVIVVSSLPMLIIYPFLQKYFVKGVMIGAIKG